MTMTATRYCELLVRDCPELQGVLSEHMSDYDDLLPHVFIGDVTRYLLEGGDGRRRIVEHLTRAFSSGEPDVENLVAVSFVENIETREDLDRLLGGVEASKVAAEWGRQKSA